MGRAGIRVVAVGTHRSCVIPFLATGLESSLNPEPPSGLCRRHRQHPRATGPEKAAAFLGSWP